MSRLETFLADARPFHLCVSATGHVRQAGRTLRKVLPGGDPVGRRFLDLFEVLRPARPAGMEELRALAGRNLRLRAGRLTFKGGIWDDGDGGVLMDLSFGIGIIDAVRDHALTAGDFSPADLAVELLFLHEAKSSAMAASFNLNARLDGARLAAETRAMTDGLTGLRNRRALEAGLARLAATRSDYALLHMDLDRFKQVNDTLGHGAGDMVLRHVARLMRAATRKDDLLVRAGGDEFVILCPGLTDLARLDALASELIDSISRPIEIEGQSVRIGASIGIAIHAGGPTPDDPPLVDAADIALYAAKRQGRGRHVVWSDALGRSLADLEPP